MMFRDKLCFGNWKLNKTPSEVSEFIDSFKSEMKDFKKDWKHFCLFPSSLLAGEFVDQSLQWGPQNIYSEESGAFTGETSVETAKAMGATYCLVGHSERRALFNEGNDFLNQKTLLAQKNGVTPVFCIGETLKEREAGETFEVLRAQVDQGLLDVDLSNLVVAYEPVWAIGTGKSATSEMVKEVHDFLKTDFGSKCPPLLYGGSVKPANAKELYAIENVNGFLIGGASLEPGSFIEIFQKMNEES